MKKLLLFAFTIVLIGCSNPLKKSIFEPLTIDELKTAITKDTLFEETYKYIKLIKDSILKSEIDRVKWADLTYDRLHKFTKFSMDTAYFKPINEKLKAEWNEKYGEYLTKVDSISNYWKKYRDENSLDQYVKVELVEIYKEHYSYSGGVRNVNLGFRLTPLKGPIDQMRFGYRIEAKLDEGKEESIYSILDKSWCRMSRPFSRPTVRYWEANYTNEKILESRNLQTFLRDYNIYTEIEEIRKDGVNMSNDDLNIPESIENHWKYENREHLKDLYVKDVINDLLNAEYLMYYEYISKEIKKILKEKDPLSFEFFQLPIRNLNLY